MMYHKDLRVIVIRVKKILALPPVSSLIFRRGLGPTLHSSPVKTAHDQQTMKVVSF